MKRKFIVTGGAGLIGSNIVRELNQMEETDILIVDHLGNSEKWKNLLDLKYKDYLEKDDFLNRIQNGNPFKKYTHTIHMGACSSTTETNASYLIQNNFEYTKVLCEYSLSNETDFIYASSAATYGDGMLGFDDDEKLITKLKPLNPYGESKNDFDKWVLEQTVRPPFWSGLKFFNVFGPNEYHKGRMASVVYHAYNQIVETGGLNLFRSHNPDFKDGGQLRDFIYVKDIFKVIDFIITKKDNFKSGIYNLGTGKARSFLDLAMSVFHALDKKVDIKFIDTPIDIRDKYQYYTKAEMDKIRIQGYLASFYSLEAGIIDYIRNYLISGIYI